MKSPSVKATSMAEAFVSVDAEAGGIDAFHYNPAATAFLTRPEMSFMGQNGVAQSKMTSLSMGAPTSAGSFCGNVLYHTLGDMDLVDTQGQVSSVNAESDFITALNYSFKYGVWGFGASGKYLSSKLVDSLKASAYSYDAGVQARFFRKRLYVGFSAQNMGSGMKYLNATEPLPFTLRGGLSYRIDFNHMNYPTKILMAFDVISEKAEDLKKSAGIEYVWNNVLSLRAGGKIDQDYEKFNFGIGFKTGKIQLDYAYSDAWNLGFINTFGLSYKFDAFDD